jgi:secondary thiamine-phosphate synthase enzyme
MRRIEQKIETASKSQIVDITDKVQQIVTDQFGFKSGFAHVFCPHTTAAVCVNESDDPDVKRDFLHAVDKLIHFEDEFKHAEGNSKGHIASIFTGASCWVPVENGKMVFGKWQSIWFCEFDGPRKRSFWVSGMMSSELGV